MIDFEVLFGAFGGSAAGMLIVSYLSKQLVEQRLKRELEVFRAGLNEQLEIFRQDLAISRERYSRDYGLFATRRNEVYAETYTAFEHARGAYSRHFSKLTETPDFSRDSISDLRHVLGKLERLFPAEREAVTALLDANRLADARVATLDAAEKHELRDANADFYTFRNKFVEYGLYFAPSVESLLDEAMSAFAALSTFAEMRMEEPKRRLVREAGEAMQKIHELSPKLRDAMRQDIQLGFAPGDKTTALEPGVSKHLPRV